MDMVSPSERDRGIAQQRKADTRRSKLHGKFQFHRRIFTAFCGLRMVLLTAIVVVTLLCYYRVIQPFRMWILDLARELVQITKTTTENTWAETIFAAFVYTVCILFSLTVLNDSIGLLGAWLKRPWLLRLFTLYDSISTLIGLPFFVFFTTYLLGCWNFGGEDLLNESLYMLTSGQATQTNVVLNKLQSELKCCGLVNSNDWWKIKLDTGKIPNKDDDEYSTMSLNPDWLIECYNKTGKICYVPLSCCMEKVECPVASNRFLVGFVDGKLDNISPFELARLMKENSKSVESINSAGLHKTGCLRRLRNEIILWLCYCISFCVVIVILAIVITWAFVPLMAYFDHWRWVEARN